MPHTPISKQDASRIQSTQAKTGKDTGKGSFSSRAQSAADRNANTNTQSQPQPKK
ncbi:uncharacterized protein B0P05DRAFT_525805 [Gilbertella persicaria]|uniref:uncharacterized protein n=1 Tax=Gilbertella persicaria TaxID=101096 RepID=UPI00221EEE45|nr:uncharacterized protein B0P05DRAFT_525805 [Gilbertella persicaria]KAI8092324.1 hypothetical protein B0P05DRAFT_525805 [Gilbertella persicaria]